MGVRSPAAPSRYGKPAVSPAERSPPPVSFGSYRQGAARLAPEPGGVSVPSCRGDCPLVNPSQPPALPALPFPESSLAHPLPGNGAAGLLDGQLFRRWARRALLSSRPPWLRNGLRPRRKHLSPHPTPAMGASAAAAAFRKATRGAALVSSLLLVSHRVRDAGERKEEPSASGASLLR